MAWREKRQRPQFRNKRKLRALFCERLLLFLFAGSGGLGGGRLDGALLEFIHAPGGIDEFLRAGIKGVADVADADDNGRFAGAGFDHVAAGATDFRVHIFRMNISSHNKGLKT